MAHFSSDSENLPELAKASQTFKKLDEYVNHVVRDTQNWQRTRRTVKNEIREIFSSLSSMLHQREMLLYEQVDLIINHIHCHDTVILGLSLGNASNSAESCLSKLTSLIFDGSDMSPQPKLKFQADVKSLQEAIQSFGCVESKYDSVSDESNFVFVNSVEDDLNMKVDDLPVQGIDFEKIDIINKTEVSSVGSCDSFEVISDDNNDTEFTEVVPETGHWATKKKSKRCAKEELNPHSVAELKNVGGSPSPLSHSAAVNKAFLLQRPRKRDVPVPECSRAEFVARDLAALQSFGDIPKAKVKKASSNDLDSHLECAALALRNENATVSNGNPVVTNISDWNTVALNPHSEVELKNADGPPSPLSHSAAVNKLSLPQWLRKRDASVPECSPADFLAQDLAALLSFGDVPKTEVEKESSNDLDSRLESATLALRNENATVSDGNAVVTNIAKSGIQNPTVHASPSGAVPEISSSGSRILGVGTDGLLSKGNSSIVPPLLRRKSGSWVDRTVLQKEGSSPFNVNCAEASYCPSLSIKKMFSPYFKTQDKNNWLVKKPHVP